MRGDDDAHPVLGERGDEARDDVAAGGVQAVEGFVHHDQLGAGDECARDEDALALAAAERAEATGRPVGEVDALEGVAHPAPHVRGDAPAPAGLADQAHGDDLCGADGEGEVEVGALGHQANTLGVHLHAPRQDLAAADDGTHERGLSAAVGADEGEGPSPDDVESQAGQRRGAPVPQRRVPEGHESRHQRAASRSGRAGTVPPQAWVTARVLWIIEPT